MDIIPVMDIKGGQVVHARAGARASYAPIKTPLAKSSDPLDVMEGFLKLYPFQSLYLADLDGIERGTPDESTQLRVLAAWPGKRVLIDDGRRPQQVPLRYASRTAVLGSEALTAIADLAGAEVLSLDFRTDVFLGPKDLLNRPEWWPSEVIVMTLNKVGMGQGPDVTRLKDIISKGGGRDVYAAGGVRHIEDLKALEFLGVRGALIASAFHNGQIKARDLEEIAGWSF